MANETQTGGRSVDIGHAAKDALLAGLIAFGLFGVFIGLQTVQDISNRLVLKVRPEALAIIVGIIVVGRFLLNVFVWGREPAHKVATPSPSGGLLGMFKRLCFLVGVVVTLVAIVDIGFRLAGGALPNMPISPPGQMGLGSIILIEAVAVLFGMVLIAFGQNMTERAAALLGPAGIGFLAAFPIIAILGAGWGGSLKWIDNFGIQILIYVMLGWGLNIVVGLAGLLDLGYVAFYAVGAYSYALLAKEFGLSFWILLPLAGILSAFWGIILGFPVLRLRGDYLAIVTLAFGEIIRMVLVNWVDFSGGYAGISGIPRPTLFGIPFNASDEGFAARFGLEFSPIYRTIFLYYLILCLALLTAFVTVRMRRMPVGRAWEALREDEIACRSLGINTTNTKLTAFALGAMFGGFAGSFFSARQGFISPESFTFIESAQILAIVVLGGMGSLYGVVIAAVVLVGGFEIMRELDFLKQIFGNDFDPALYRGLIFGASMVVIMLWKPRGLISTRTPTAFLKERKTVSGDLVKEGHG
ncbi:high-affinity branched-chain amino acid ABC transporter permease LivM [Prosthecodimorpha staleyi]|uniref:High-affinity branched-chain amino acid ABC transporter permease LivM n=1 Tax=Prosthecodimorpha staleyi TaxID=2840188 RepID=A0A947CZI4_9HYPH|nr:high-affinity branched-chain amino acid ABC transporter permease LivM [Prosthecodimorpha staleyi]